MRKIFSFQMVLLMGLALLFFAFGKQDAPKPDPWKPEELMKPLDLAKILIDPKAKQPAIFNTGPMKNIKSAISVGAVSSPEGLAKFKTEVAKVPKDKMVVVYCGCCTMKNCPNIRPAYEHLKKSGYKKIRLLDIETDLHKDWETPGYPME